MGWLAPYSQAPIFGRTSLPKVSVSSLLAPLVSNSNTNSNPVISLDGTRVAYQAYNPSVPGGSQIFVVNSDGTGNQQLTNNGAASNFSPSIDGNGTRIVFFSDVSNVAGLIYQVFSINSDGTYPCPSSMQVANTGCELTSTPTNINTYPVITADGSSIAFQSNRTSTLQIYVMKTDGSQLRQLSAGAGKRNEHASISNDAKKIVFQSNITSTGEIYSINSDGTGLTQLTNNNCIDRYPVISGDGRYVVFQSNCTGNWQVMQILSNGTVPPCLYPIVGTGCRVTNNTTGLDQLPTVNIDGSLVVWMGNESLPNSNSNPSGHNQIFTADIYAFGYTQLTNNTASYNGNPSVDGAGDKVVYQSDVNGANTQIYLAKTLPFTSSAAFGGGGSSRVDHR